MSTTTKHTTASVEFLEPDSLDALQAAFAALEADLNTRIIGQTAHVRVLLTALLSRRHCWFPGPPGTGKTTLALELAKSIEGAKTFYVALSEEASDAIVLGPYNPMLLQHGKWERQIEGYMADADICILDEITRSNAAVRNAILNPLEKRFLVNGNRQVALPPGFIACALSNHEFPEGAEALRDRFSLALPFLRLNPSDRRRLREREIDGGMPAPAALISKDDVAVAQQLIDQVIIPKPVRNDLELLVSQLRQGVGNHKPVDVSERQDLASIRPLKAHAFLSGRMTVTPKDYPVLAASLWTELRDLKAIEEALGSLTDIGKQALAIAGTAQTLCKTEMLRYRSSRDASEREEILGDLLSELKRIRKEIGIFQLQAQNERLPMDKITTAQGMVKPLLDEVARELAN